MSAATAGRKPNSVPRLLRLRTLTSASARVGEATIIPLAPSLLTGSSGLPGSLGRVVRWALLPGTALPYLALLRAGFCLPRLLPGARCALTAPFHPCLFAPAVPERPSAVCFLCHFPSSCPDRALPGTLPCGVRTFLLHLRAFTRRGDDRPAHCDPFIVSTRRFLAISDTARVSCRGSSAACRSPRRSSRYSSRSLSAWRPGRRVRRSP
jgi:hypothetical protein